MPSLGNIRPMKEGQCVLVAALALGLIYLLFRYFAVSQAVPVVSVSPLRVLREEYTIWPAFISKLPHIPEWYTNECFDGRTSEDLEEIFGSLIPTWAESLHLDCQEAYALFLEMFEVHQRVSGPLEMPKAFAKKVQAWLGGDEAFKEKIDKQAIIHVFHPLVAEHVVYNPVRAQRPMPSQEKDIFQWVDERVIKTEGNCDFCRHSSYTASDKFGRHETKDTVRVSNTFKMDVHHSMVVPSHVHHPLHLPLPLLMHLFEEATQWFFDVSQQEPHYIYPNIAWDTLFHAGASQVHPHIHMMLAPDHYYGSMEGLRAAAQTYFRVTGRNYFNSLVSIHGALGLAVEYGDAVALANLVGKGDLEVMILSDIPSKDFFSLIYFAVQAFHDTFKQPCKSLAGAWPALGMSRNASLGRLPAIARMVSRGDCTSLRADFSTFEIFQAVFKPHNPWQLATAIRKSIEKYDTQKKE